MVAYIRIDPQEKLTEIQQEISALHKLYSSQPVFGVEYTTQVLAHGVSYKYLQILHRTSPPRKRRSSPLTQWRSTTRSTKPTPRLKTRLPHIWLREVKKTERYL